MVLLQWAIRSRSGSVNSGSHAYMLKAKDIITHILYHIVSFKTMYEMKIWNGSINSGSHTYMHKAKDTITHISKLCPACLVTTCSEFSRILRVGAFWCKPKCMPIRTFWQIDGQPFRFHWVPRGIGDHILQVLDKQMFDIWLQHHLNHTVEWVQIYCQLYKQ